MSLIEKDVPMMWDEFAKSIFEKSTHCCICEERFQYVELHCHNQFETKTNCKICIENQEKIPVRDHCHFTGIFCGSAHPQCNLQYQIKKSKYQLPIFFHNLRGYDLHLIF